MNNNLIMLLVVDSGKPRAHAFPPEPAEPGVAQNYAVLVALDQRCVARLPLAVVLVVLVAVVALIAAAVVLVGVVTAHLVALAFLR